MNTKSSACTGCLSVDRKLTLLNGNYRRIFLELLDATNYTEAMLLCFECRSLVRRIYEFKNQVQEANHYFSNYMVHEETQTLSKLKFNHVSKLDTLQENNTNIINLKHNEKGIHNKLMKYEISDKNSSKLCDHNYGQEIGVNLDSKICKDTSGNFLQPLAFVKMEDSHLEIDDFDADDFKFNRSFSDSDDEPLTMKSKKVKKKKTKDKIDKCSKKESSGVVCDPRVQRKLQALNVDPNDIALVLLTWEEVEDERRALLQSAQFSRHALRCGPCALTFNHQHKLEEHNTKHSPEAGDEVCEFCTVRCKTKAALAAHRRRHRARWVCQQCGRGFSRAGVAADHRARQHAGAAPRHACPRCDHAATSLGSLRAHMRSHAPRPECALCGKTFRDKSSLRTHIFVHRGVKEHVCPTCGKRFMFKKQREIHELTHLSHQHLYCHQCDVSFKNQTSYYQHMRYSLKHIDPKDIKHECGTCGRRFVRAARLAEHALAVHLKLAPLRCPLPGCGFSCASGAALRSHRRAAHGAGTRTCHVCHRCGNTYKSKKSLEGHLRSHNGVQKTTQEAK